MLIWQEFKTIVSDAWAAITSLSRWLLTQIQWALAKAAFYYQPIIVSVIGFPISLFLLGVPFVELLNLLGVMLQSMFRPIGTVSDYRGVNGFAMILMFFCGLIIFTFTVELTDRIQMRLEGKAKDADSSDETGTK